MRRHEHKSLNGCCICRCKSSTSRFAKSDVWEKYFPMCFLLPPKQRKGDICNACVLVVKRFCKKKKETTFEYVVDCRSGPGSKSMAKIKKKRNIIQQQNNSFTQAKGLKEIKKDSQPKHQMKRKQGKDKIFRTLFQPSEMQLMSHMTFCPYEQSDGLSWGDVHMQHGSIDLPEYLEAHFKGYKLCCGILFHSEKTGEVICPKAFYKPCPLHLQLAHKRLSLSSSPTNSMSGHSSSSPSSPLSQFQDETQQCIEEEEDDEKMEKEKGMKEGRYQEGSVNFCVVSQMCY